MSRLTAEQAQVFHQFSDFSDTFRYMTHLEYVSDHMPRNPSILSQSTIGRFAQSLTAIRKEQRDAKRRK
jgi:hypothetical protein